MEVASNSPALAIQLKPAAWLRLRVVDESGNPKAHVSVRLQGWRGYNTLSWGGFTDDNGKIEWDSAPHDVLNIYAGKEGYFSSRENMITADGEEHTITLRPQVTVSGFVTDSESGEPIPAFKAIPGSERIELVHGTNGEYTLAFTELRAPLEVHFEAEGYESGASGPLPANRTTQTINISLKRQKSSEAVQGLVLFAGWFAGGWRASGAVHGGKRSHAREWKNFRHEDSILTVAGADGHFVFPAVSAPQTVLAINDQGFAQLQVGTNHNVTLVLKPWGRIEGALKLRSGKNTARQINLMNRPSASGRGAFRVSLSADTDAQGNFVFERLPYGDFDLYLFPGMYRPFTHETPVQVEAGNTLAVKIGGTGGTVTGKFVLSDTSRAINWATQTRNAIISTIQKPPPVPPDLTGDARRQWVQAYRQSEAGMAESRAMHSYPLTVETDGTFTAEDVPPGSYNLTAVVLSLPVDESDMRGSLRAPRIGSLSEKIVVPESATNPASDAVNLGTVTINLIH